MKRFFDLVLSQPVMFLAVIIICATNFVLNYKLEERDCFMRQYNLEWRSGAYRLKEGASPDLRDILKSQREEKKNGDK